MYVFDGLTLAFVGFKSLAAGMGLVAATGQEHIRDG